VRLLRSLATLFLAAAAWGNAAPAQEPAGAAAAEPKESAPLAYPVRFDEEAVASESALASAVGARILERGGNAVDAAVATAFALAVTLPIAGNLGGGGFLVAWAGDRAGGTCFDFRETAPRAATERMFLDGEGRYDRERHHWSILSVGVPGSVAGLRLAHDRVGKMPWPDLVQPAVELAERGFPVSRGLAESLSEVLPSMAKYPASMAQFSREGKPLRPGEILRQPDLARTLGRIRNLGADDFYRGETAGLIVAEMERLGGIVRKEDLQEYYAVERKPVQGTYRGYEVLSMPPPSSGGVALIEMLNILEGYDLAAPGLRSARETHLIIESMRRAYADRALHLGDPDRVEVPVGRLISKEHARELRATIRPDRASRSSPTVFRWTSEGSQTTHLSVIDRNRMAVSLTTTLEQAYGSRIVVPGAGFLLNNEMGDFNPVPGSTDEKGRIGTPPNLVAPGKRMLSSMTPTIVVRDGIPVLVVGSPGGRTIINTVLQVVLDVLDHGVPIQDAVDLPRFHHQWLPDRVSAEVRCFSPETRKALEELGHAIVTEFSAQGAVMALGLRKAAGGRLQIEAGVDRRRPDTGAAGR